MIRVPLSKEQVINAIERTGTTTSVPVVFHKWWGDGLEKKYGHDLIKIAEKYPDDIFVGEYIDPGTTDSPTSNPSYRWGYKSDYSSAERHSISEATVLLTDWSELPQLIADFPDPYESATFDKIKESLSSGEKRYKLGHFWRLFHERFWTIRGMENLMMDYYDNMDELKLLGQTLNKYYKVIIDRYAELGFDGIFTSDDLGHQSGPMMSPSIFNELYLPLYKEFVSYAHSKGMHVFLHSCGDNTLLMEDIIASGVDVFHPIQVGCMDVAETAKKYGNRISFLAGIDVQHLLPEETVPVVKSKLTEMMNLLYKPEGGLLMAAGNGIMPDTPLENIDAALEVICTYKGRA